MGGYAEDALVMPRNGSQFSLLGGRERLAIVPGVVGGRQAPEIALMVEHNPLLVGSIDEQGHAWILQRPSTVRADQKGKAAPPVLD